MKYWIEPVGNKRFYTEKLLEMVAGGYGHEVDLDQDSIILVSLCDVSELLVLRRIRNKYPSHTIVAGGHFAKIGLEAMAIWADLVWVGHVFDMLALRTWQEICESPHAYWCGRRGTVQASTRIDWDRVPAIQVDKNRLYLWGGTGCQKKCSFCLTSWTEPHQERPGLRGVCSRLKQRMPKGYTLKVISNAYTTELGDDLVQDMMIQDLLRVRRNRKRKLIRCGVEFPTEKSRGRHAKPIRDEQIRHAIQRAADFNLSLQLFFIGGRDPRQDWEHLLDVIPPDDMMKPKVYFKWTNIEYQPKTPLWPELAHFTGQDLLDKAFTDWFYRKAAHKNKRVSVYTCKYPAHTVWRMCLAHVTTELEFNAVHKLRNTKDLARMMELFRDLQPWEHDLSWVQVPPHDARRDE